MTKKVLIDVEALQVAWQLIYTREWPFTMMGDLAAVKVAVDEALRSDIEVKGDEV